MFKINHCFDKTKNCPKEFKTLNQAIIFCDDNFDEMYQIVKVVKDEILDIYELVLGTFILTAHSCATGRTYSYFKW